MTLKAADSSAKRSSSKRKPHKPNVFISYSSADQDRVVSDLDRTLREHGINTYLVERDLSPGGSILDTLSRGITSTDALVVIVSKNSIHSNWVQQELNAAVVHRLAGIVKRIVPVILDDVRPPDALAATTWERISDPTSLLAAADRIAGLLKNTIPGSSSSMNRQSTRREIQGLPNLDKDEERLFAEICDRVIDAQSYFPIVSSKEIIDAAQRANINRDHISEIVRYLEQRYYLTDVGYFLGSSDPGYARITYLGLARYLDAYLSNQYLRDQANIISAIVNENARDREKIAYSLHISEAIVAHVFEYLERSGYATVSRGLRETEITPKSTMRKLLDQISDQISTKPANVRRRVAAVGEGHDRNNEPSDIPAGHTTLKTIKPDQLEIDLRSTNAIIYQRNAAIPQLSIWLRITNHADIDLRITHLTAELWFGQPTTKLHLDRPIKIPSHSTLRDVAISEILDDSKAKYIDNFLSREDMGKTLYVNLAIACESENGSFTRDIVFERREPEISTIVR